MIGSIPPARLRGALALLAGVGLLVLAPAAGAETYQEAVEGTAGVTHFWPMGEASGSSLADVVGGANAEVSGGVTLGEPGGLVGDSATAAAFNGSSGAAQAKVDLSGTHRLTVEFWMKWSAFAQDDRLALEFTPNFNENPGGFLVDPDATPESDFAVAVGRSATGNNNNVLFARPSAEAWHYYAFVIDTEASGETEITPYLDGHAVSYFKLSADTGAGAFADSTLYWMSRDASSLFGAGSMQDLALYDTTLSAIGPSGEIWVLDRTNFRVEEFNEKGEYLTQFGYEDPVFSPGAEEAIAVGAHGDVWLSDPYNHSLSVFDPAGELLKTVGSRGTEPGQWEEPDSIAISKGDVWVADWSNERVEEFNEAGEYLKEFGSEGSGVGEFQHPDGIAISPRGDVWVGDRYNARIQEFNGEGEYLTQLSSSEGVGAGKFGFSLPIGLAFNSAEDLWVTGSDEDHIQEWATVQVPSSTAAPDVRGEALAGQTLSASPGTWAGSPASYDYQWQRCNTAGEECASISGATASSYTLATGDLESTLRVLVTATNPAGSATAASSVTSVIAAAVAPTNSAAPSISGTAKDGQTLGASLGTWAGTAPITYAYQWQNCNAQGEECVEVEGATGQHYTLGSGDDEATTRVLVTASNAAGSAQATSAASPEIQAGPPSELQAPTIAGNPGVGSALHADAGQWAGSETEVGYHPQADPASIYSAIERFVSGTADGHQTDPST
jgi:hypothetical protein